MQAHNGKTVKTKNALAHIQNAGIIRTAGDRSGKALLKRCHVQRLSAITNNGTHICFLLKTNPWESCFSQLSRGSCLLFYILQGIVALFTGTNLYNIFNIVNEDLTVADMSCV